MDRKFCRTATTSLHFTSSSPKTSSGKKKQRKAKKRPTEYWDSLPAISGSKTKNRSSHYTNPSSAHMSNMSCNSGPKNLRRNIDKIEKIQRRATKMIPEIGNHSYHQRIKDLDLISLVQRRLRGQLIEVFKYLNEFNSASARELFDYDLNDRTRNNGAKLIVTHFNTSVDQDFYPIKITTTWNALPSELVSSRIEKSFKNSLDKHWAENPPNDRVNW